MGTWVLATGEGVNLEETFNPPFSSIGELISTLLPNVYILAGIILLVLFVAGGFGIISSAGKGEKEGMAQGKKLVTASLIGFIIVIGSYWVVQIISTITGISILNPSLP
jgi:FtsH-binding integral membrane protein